MSVDVESEGRGWFFGWLRGIFGRREESSWEDKIQAIVYKLKEQQSKLDELSFRMEERAKELFERTVEHLRRASRADLKEDERKAHYSLARTFAEEISEIRRFLKAIKFTSISLEKAAMRLQTVRDLKGFREVLVPVSKLLAEVKNEIAPIFPSIGQALDEVNKSIAELLLHASAGLQTVAPEPSKADDDVSKILSEAWAAANESVEKKIPEPAKFLAIDAGKNSAGGKAAIYAESLAEERDEAPASRASRHSSPASLAADSQLRSVEETVLAEIRASGGRLEISELSKRLNVPNEKLLEALYNLSKKGKIRIRYLEGT